MTIEAIVLQIFGRMRDAKQWFVYGNFFGGITEFFEQHNRVVFEASHVFVSVIATGAQKIGAIVATGHGIFFAFA